MSLTPQKFREAVVLFLFSLDFSNDIEDTMTLVQEELKITKKNADDALKKAQFILKHINDIDLIISKYSTEYEFHRIPHAEKNILRLSFFELAVEKTLNYKVIISEGIRLTRKFASREAGAFTNALLDNYVKEYLTDQNDQAPQSPDSSSS
jgi:transcription antitermination protein NusB